jgi:integrase
MGKLNESRLRAWLRDMAPIAGQSDGEGLTFTLGRPRLRRDALTSEVSRAVATIRDKEAAHLLTCYLAAGTNESRLAAYNKARAKSQWLMEKDFVKRAERAEIAFIKSLPPALRTPAVVRAGAAAWTFRYRYAGRQRETTLGNYPDMSLADARVAARKARVEVDRGVDVAAEKRRVILEAMHAGTFRELSADYMQKGGALLAPSSRKECQRYLDKDILPRIGALPAADVTGREIVTMIERIAARSDSVARHAFEILAVIFAHAVARHYVPTNPCAGLKLTAILGPRPARRLRIKLTEKELRSLMTELPKLGYVNALAVKILLATCVRKSELLLAKRAHVDLAVATWTVPAENSKSGTAFVVPLAPTVAEWFRELMTLKSRDDWLVPGLKGHLSRTALNVALGRLEGIRRFSPHDLRSTARSYLTSQHVGVSITVAERCLNHSLGGLVAVYDQHDYLPERRHALEVWAKFIEGADEELPSNVTALRAAA